MKKHLLLLWLLLLGSIGLAAAQSRQVQGVVKDAKGETLPGVTVLVEGTTNGASTGANGDFNITLPANSANATLRFSYVGYVSQAVKVGSQSTINVTLASDSKQLDDVVVIGYQEVQRRDVTGSVSSVSAKQIKDIPVNSAAEALTGRLAGVQLTASEGSPGANVTVRVRGGGSVTQDNSPLYVVDGVQVENALAVIAPQDIASVDVLKDASATAIYGARGANGVVIITTKTGREGKTVINYNGFVGFRKLAKTLDVMNPQQFVDYQYERANSLGSTGLSAFKTRFGTTNFRSDTLQRLRNASDIDWQQEVFGRRALMQTHNISVSGGSKGTTYSLSLTNNQENGIQQSSGYVRNLLNFRFDNKATEKLRLGFNVRYNDQVIEGAGTSTNGTTPQGVSTSSINTRLRNTVIYAPLTLPNLSSNDPNAFDEDFVTNSNLVNPLVAIDNDYRRNRRKVLNLAGNASLQLAKGLTFRSTGGIDITNSAIETFYGQYSPTLRQPAGNFNGQPFANILTNATTSINNSNVLSYNYITGKHTFDALIGEEIYQQLSTEQNIQTKYLPKELTPEQAIANINQGVLPAGGTFAQPLPTTDRDEYRLLSGFARLNYNYDERYLFTATVRADGSSKFGANNRVGYFPAASAAWRISREAFMKDISQISDLKLRVSVGEAGNNRIENFLYSQLFQTGNSQYVFNGVAYNGAASTRLPNPNLKWESTSSRNVGIDLALFNNRLQLTADAYYNTTHDLLVAVPISSVSGYTSQTRNIGSTTNRGLELQLTSTIIQTPDFSWTATANTAMNRGRIESLGDAQSILSYSGWASSDISNDFLTQVGGTVGQFYGYVVDYTSGNGKGFYTADDFTGYNASTKTWTPKPGVVDDNATTGNPLAPGTIRLKDLNGDGVITEADRQVIGNANPKLVGGLNQQFTYKNFDASVFLNFVYGNDVYNANKIEFTTSRYAYANLLATMNDRFRTIDANGATITSAETSRNLNQNASIWTPTRKNFLSSYAIENGSFVRVNNVTFGYTLPKAVLSRAKVTQLRLYVTLNNLYVFTKYSGYDPEANTRQGPKSPLTPGVDYAAYPRSRGFLFGANLSF
ncbi:TonB-dependent receptor [Microvirga sp. STS02]|uniref:SusC/RagA family TonB-linked outer membrane protein n=1 Tax=Hymenobacter negativus TaxID=2795026 RepID=UPI0018DDBA10|nr:MULTISPECIES: TonB-dependent receptor [Bacteria]MBH8569883.1 TonB-dependent receptor [Hymenobacter negativus]MBR7209622.1 TonB-dependent receptor [Microvirga sp. STS02]